MTANTKQLSIEEKYGEIFPSHDDSIKPRSNSEDDGWFVQPNIYKEVRSVSTSPSAMPQDNHRS
ncbi:hypothetical protein MNBD_GAMMA06-106 [hydrothermal vent metagenome]|uniref:Uncharacterized protein n=1 Tax=hydrothermal vent metagenome TaxID=652676 RepID=A0A3B0X3Q8_9ZZZZ